MLLLISDWLQGLHSGFGVIQFITFRAIVATLTAMGIGLVVGPWLIRRLVELQIGQQVRDDGPQSHLSKSGTPTMGGSLMLLGIAVATLLWADLGNHLVWIVLLVTLAFGTIGGADDYYKLIRASSHGLSARQKYLAQSGVGLLAALALFATARTSAETSLLVPFAKDWLVPLGWLFVPLTYCVIVGSSNAVNLTDGLDGLAILPAVLVAGALGVFAYATSRVDFAAYLGIPYVQGAGEVVVFCGALVGAGLGFLWFNTYPAQVFMGDVGSLAIGAALGTVAVVVRQELVLFIMAGVFVAETLSVMLQVMAFKSTGRRVFRMAPLHHHFELKGWPEPRVIVRFWIVTVVLVLIGLASLKLR